eukprot:TRINITY_DN1160_c0_g1_i4.p1 TRINITY_DN1160_c0_g1~~TRINITY_DN1160_c0_g1_i4.p1  ORF type:complete len:169 (+),score=12.82 TRINITY_DN1160_c0_g1_i4:48-554(+)
MADRTRTQPPHAMTASSAFPPLRGCSPVISEYTGEGTRPSRLPNHARRSPTKMLSHSQDSNAQHHSVPVTQISQRRPHPDLCDDSTRISPSNRRLYPDSFNRTTFHEDFAQSPGRRLFQYLPPPHNPDAPKRFESAFITSWQSSHVSVYCAAIVIFHGHWNVFFFQKN